VVSACPGIRQTPVARQDRRRFVNVSGYLRRYGRAQSAVCLRWFVAHKDGTPVYHAAPMVQP
jgi:hypothetical protein